MIISDKCRHAIEKSDCLIFWSFDYSFYVQKCSFTKQNSSVFTLKENHLGFVCDRLKIRWHYPLAVLSFKVHPKLKKKTIKFPWKMVISVTRLKIWKAQSIKLISRSSQVFSRFGVTFRLFVSCSFFFYYFLLINLSNS